jgi:hypothetical protein
MFLRLGELTTLSDSLVAWQGKCPPQTPPCRCLERGPPQRNFDKSGTALHGHRYQFELWISYLFYRIIMHCGFVVKFTDISALLYAIRSILRSHGRQWQQSRSLLGLSRAKFALLTSSETKQVLLKLVQNLCLCLENVSFRGLRPLPRGKATQGSALRLLL